MISFPLACGTISYSPTKGSFCLKAKIAELPNGRAPSDGLLCPPVSRPVPNGTGSTGSGRGWPSAPTVETAGTVDGKTGLIPAGRIQGQPSLRYLMST